MPWQWRFVEEQCIACGICADVCPQGAVRMTEQMAYPEAVDGRCTGCMICVTECPPQTIAVAQLAPLATG
jgi:ferredoxin